jgi:hypothetical protein
MGEVHMGVSVESEHAQVAQGRHARESASHPHGSKGCVPDTGVRVESASDPSESPSCYGGGELSVGGPGGDQFVAGGYSSFGHPQRVIEGDAVSSPRT